MALSAEQAKHTENVFQIALRQSETHLARLSCSDESATEALSLALHSVPRVFHLALRGGSTRLKITWVQQKQYHRAHGSARERVLSLALRGGSIPTLHLNFFSSFL